MQTRTLVGVGALSALLLSPPIVSARECKVYPEEARARVRSSHASVNASEIAAREENGITFVTGGIADERAALERTSHQYNLKLTMTSPCGRMAVAPLRIEDQQGETLVNSPDAGPLFYAKLPAGKYTVHVSPRNGEPLVKTVSVPSSGQAKAIFHISQRGGSGGDAGE